MDKKHYYIQERGRIAGPFDLAQLKEMRRRMKLARFHKISTDRKTWVGAETLVELFSSEPAPSSPPDRGPNQVPPPGKCWYYALGTQVYGPVETRDLQQMIDRGAIGPATLVQPEDGTVWMTSRQVGFRFDAHAMASAGGAAEPHPGQSRTSSVAWLAGSLAAVSMAIAATTVAILVYKSGSESTSVPPVKLPEPASPAIAQKSPGPPEPNAAEPKPEPPK